MLYLETIQPTTLELLKRIMADKQLPAFRLVGGTSLALQMGHRLSVDLDLFTDETFDEVNVREYLEYNYNFQLDFIARETLKGTIQDVVVDCIAHKYAWIRPCIEIDGIRLVSLEDLCAMKLNAISNSGTRIKDFIDLAYLSTQFSLTQMLEFYEEKYVANSLIPLKALTYFADINIHEPVCLINGKKLNWTNIEKRLLDMDKYPKQVFSSTPL